MTLRATQTTQETGRYTSTSTFFLTDLPPTITESTLRKLLRHDLSVSVSFHDSPAGTVAMVEARATQEAERVARELVQSTRDAGTPLTVITRESPEGQQLAVLFASHEEHEQRACFHLPQVCVHVAASGDMAVTLNRTRAFDAILSDVQMPGLDGLSLVAEIKRIRAHTPVVLMAGGPNLMPLLIGSGAFGFMRKLVNTDCPAACY